MVVLTARSGVDDRIRGLELGADDYVTKPFSPTEVVLRVQAVLHRTAAGRRRRGLVVRRRPAADRRGPPRGDLATGSALDLTPTEWGVLAALAAVPGRVYSRYELVNRVRGYEFAGYERTIDSHVKNLRRKLGADGGDRRRDRPRRRLPAGAAAVTGEPTAGPVGRAPSRSASGCSRPLSG